MGKQTMTEEQVKAFYRAIGKVMRDHKVEAIAGVWFGCDDTHGQLLFSNVADLRMTAVVKGISDRWEAYLKAEQVERGPQIGYIREISADDDINN